ncbi:MAG: flagellar biosynthetic protein FliO [Rhizomicrobium sp.]
MSGTRFAAALLVLAACRPAAAQTLGQGADDGISTWRVIAVLLLCLALAVYAAYVLRARLGGAPRFAWPLLSRTKIQRRLQLVETLRLSHQIDLCVVTCDGQDLLVAASAQGVEILRELPPGAATAAQGRV